jgi:hypothetical protein
MIDKNYIIIVIQDLFYQDTLSRFQANQSLLFLLNAVCLVEKKQIPNFKSLVRPDLGSNTPSNALEVSTLTITPPKWLTKMEIAELALNNNHSLQFCYFHQHHLKY